MNVNAKNDMTYHSFILYENIKALRIHNGLSIKEMADVIGIREERLLQVEWCLKAGLLYDIHIRNVCQYFAVPADRLMESPLSW